MKITSIRNYDQHREKTKESPEHTYSKNKDENTKLLEFFENLDTALKQFKESLLADNKICSDGYCGRRLVEETKVFLEKNELIPKSFDDEILEEAEHYYRVKSGELLAEIARIQVQMNNEYRENLLETRIMESAKKLAGSAFNAVDAADESLELVSERQMVFPAEDREEAENKVKNAFYGYLIKEMVSVDPAFAKNLFQLWIEYFSVEEAAELDELIVLSLEAEEKDRLIAELHDVSLKPEDMVEMIKRAKLSKPEKVSMITSLNSRFGINSSNKDFSSKEADRKSGLKLLDAQINGELSQKLINSSQLSDDARKLWTDIHFRGVEQHGDETLFSMVQHYFYMGEDVDENYVFSLLAEPENTISAEQAKELCSIINKKINDEDSFFYRKGCELISHKIKETGNTEEDFFDGIKALNEIVKKGEVKSEKIFEKAEKIAESYQERREGLMKKFKRKIKKENRYDGFRR